MDMTNISGEREEDSGIDSGATDPQDTTAYIRISVPELKLQKCLQFSLEDSVWTAKQTVLSTVAKELKDGLNYGLYSPPNNGRAGKFLDEERTLRDYPLPGPIGFLEFKYKRRVYKLMQINPKKLKQLHTKANLRQFVEYVKKNDVERVTKMTNRGLDPNFHDHESGDTPLTCACRLTKPSNMLLTLIGGGAHIDYRARDSLTPMHRAAQKGNTEAVKTLLDLGASPNSKDVRGLTPLYHSVTGKANERCVQMLLHDHALIGCHDDQGWTEIHQACKLGQVQVLEHLLYYGAEMNVQNSSGNTPLHVCAVNNQDSCARVLLFRGADRDIQNFANQSAFQVAVISGNTELATVIQTFNDNQVVPFQELPSYNEKRRTPTISTLNTLKRTRSNPSLHLLFGSDSQSASPVLSHDSSLRHFPNGSWNDYDNMSISSAGSFSGSTAASVPDHYSVPHHHSNHNQRNRMSRSYSSDMLNRRHSCDLTPTPPEKPRPSATRGFPDRVQSMLSKYFPKLKRSQSNVSLRRTATGRQSMPTIPSYQAEILRFDAPVDDEQAFLCIQSYSPRHPGELRLRKGQMVQVVSVGEQGYWEGRVNHREGWFPSNHVQQVQIKPNKGTKSLPGENGDSVIVKKDALASLVKQDRDHSPRIVVLQKGKRGFGFVLRGAKCEPGSLQQKIVAQQQATPTLDFVPTSEFPALQYLDSVDKGSPADRAGLKPGDFLLQINDESVINATHEHTVRLIKQSGDMLAMKVVTVKPAALEDASLDLHIDGTRTLPTKKKAEAAHYAQRQSPSSLTQVQGRRSAWDVQGLMELEKLDQTLAHYDGEPDTHSLHQVALAKGVNVRHKTASIGRHSQRVSTMPLQAVFSQTDDGMRSESERYTQNIDKQPHRYTSPQDDQSQQRYSHSGPAPLERARSTPSLVPTGAHVTSINIDEPPTNQSEHVYAVPFKSVPGRGSDQHFLDGNLSVRIGGSAAIPPPPNHPPPQPPRENSGDSGEIVCINTKASHGYANISGEIQASSVKSNSPVESSFRPGSGARMTKEPATKPAVSVHSRSSSMSSSVSSLSSHSEQKASYAVEQSPREQNAIRSDSPRTQHKRTESPREALFVKKQDSSPRQSTVQSESVTQKPYYEPEPDYERESTPSNVSSGSERKAVSQDLRSAIKAAALARETKSKTASVPAQQRTPPMQHKRTPPPPPQKSTSPPQRSVTTQPSSQKAVPPAPPPPPPPAPAPPPPPPLPKTPEDQPKKSVAVPAHVQRQLQDNRRQEERHAALMAAIAKRRNLVDSADMGVIASNIDSRVGKAKPTANSPIFDSGKTTTKPVAPSEVHDVQPGNPTSQQDTPNGLDAAANLSMSDSFTARAEKARQEYLSMKTGSSTPGTLDRSLGNRSDVIDEGNVDTTPGLAGIAAVIAQRARANQKNFEEVDLKVKSSNMGHTLLDTRKSTGNKSPVAKTSPNVNNNNAAPPTTHPATNSIASRARQFDQAKRTTFVKPATKVNSSVDPLRNIEIVPPPPVFEGGEVDMPAIAPPPPGFDDPDFVPPPTEFEASSPTKPSFTRTTYTSRM